MDIKQSASSTQERRAHPLGTSLWHPFADMAQVAGRELVLERGEGIWLWDTAGRRYIDAAAGLWFCNVGHGRTELADAAAKQMRRLAAHSTFGDLANEPALAIASRVAGLAPIPDAAVFLTSGGSESIDTAAKIVRRYWNVVGRPDRQILIVREGAYHGMAGYGTSLAGIEANATGWGQLVGGVIRVPPDDPGAVAQVLQQQGDRIAAFFGEPVRGAGGVHPPISGYWPEIARLCKAHDVLLVTDEVITGFGRLGTWFASTRYGIEPDMIVGAKGVTSGYAQLGVVLCGPRVQEPFWRGQAGMLRHGYTYSGHATACAVGLANLDLLEREHLVDRVRDLEPVFAAEFQRLKEHPLVAEVRCVGLLAGVELAADTLSAIPKAADLVCLAARERGVLMRHLLGRTLQFSPPFVITEREVRQMVTSVSESLTAVGDELQQAGKHQ